MIKEPPCACRHDCGYAPSLPLPTANISAALPIMACVVATCDLHRHSTSEDDEAYILTVSFHFCGRQGVAKQGPFRFHCSVHKTKMNSDMIIDETKQFNPYPNTS